MARKPQRGRPQPPAKKGAPRRALAAAAVLAVLLLAGLGFQFGWFGPGGAKPLAPPPARTPDGRVVVLEFFDYG